MRSVLSVTLGFFLLAAAGRAADPITVDLWPGGKPPGQAVEPGPDTVNKNKSGKVRLTDVTRPQIVVYPAPKEKNTGTALIIAPGGGYKDLGWDFEGVAMAEWCNKLGVTGIILKYRVPNNAKGASLDGQRSVGLVRSRAKEWGIDPHKIGMIGFSAGGGVMNIVLLSADKRGYEPVDEHDKASSRLDWGVFIYSAGGLAGKDGKNTENITKEKIPPLFMAVGYDDFTVNGMVQSFQALKKAGVQVELHVYATGPHAFGGNILNPPIPLIGDWSQRLEAWMRYQKLLDTTKVP